MAYLGGVDIERCPPLTADQEFFQHVIQMYSLYGENKGLVAGGRASSYTSDGLIQRRQSGFKSGGSRIRVKKIRFSSNFTQKKYIF